MLQYTDPTWYDPTAPSVRPVCLLTTNANVYVDNKNKVVIPTPQVPNTDTEKAFYYYYNPSKIIYLYFNGVFVN